MHNYRLGASIRSSNKAQQHVTRRFENSRVEMKLPALGTVATLFEDVELWI